MKSLSRLLSKERITWLESVTKEEALRELAGALTATVNDLSEGDVYEAILERERLLSTGFGLGLAIPHAKLAGARDFAVSLGIHTRGLEYESLDDNPVHILVMIVGPTSRQEEYLKVLSRVTAFLKDNRENLLTLGSTDEIYNLTLDY